MSGLSDYLEDALIDAVLRGIPYTSPPTVYVALYLSDPTDADIGTEVSGPAYLRRAAMFSAPSNGTSSNTGAVTFPKATGAWGTVTHFGVRDALSGGNLLFYGALATARDIDTNDQPDFEAGTLFCQFQ